MRRILSTRQSPCQAKLVWGAGDGDLSVWQAPAMPKRRSKPKRALRPNYIKQWREARGKTQAQLAEYMGISEGHLSRIERGEKEYMQSLLEAAAEYLETDAASLLMRNPQDPAAIWSIWDHASKAQREDIQRLAEVIVTSKKAG